jgi:hypothetical protein
MVPKTKMGELDGLVVRPVFFRWEGSHRSKSVKMTERPEVSHTGTWLVQTTRDLEKFVHVHRWNYL